MICALLIGRGGSVTFPIKNIFPVVGRPLCAYPLIAAQASNYVTNTFVSTDSPEMAAIARGFQAELINRPPELAASSALGEHVFQHRYYEIKRRLALANELMELIVLLFANAPTVTAGLIDSRIEMLLKDPDLDSAVTTSIYNMWSPLRARKLDESGHLQPFVPFETFGDPATLNCDRDSQGDVYFADMSVSIVRPRCLEQLEAGLLPQKWMGQRIAPIPSLGGDVDYEWQVPGVEYWLRQHGYNPAQEALS
jgi:CMP-N-acetylneuraminic acid synthetase